MMFKNLRKIKRHNYIDLDDADTIAYLKVLFDNDANFDDALRVAKSKAPITIDEAVYIIENRGEL